ncbi:aldo/keto reductase [Bosea sp. (in: a-proteobacteria)]|uniref:aldo/keto reductase n=1 Tax=Bosea sp. (in: a-proteobacteria) TaxID=1871050 RepID=UPI00263299EF|nr:aldo/keto reductase [Bosea sp. (in: a-proteobacteria)]MCO5089476.1 aldo/keto reductase [Bosea sp. (in: a-proteobacteria)]
MCGIYFRKSFQRSFGTYPLKGEELKQALGHALAVGYRAIDTAQSYQNEAEVGRAIAESGIPRDELCITTKVRPSNFGPNEFLPSVEKSLTELGLPFVDVLLLHWPPIGGDVRPSLEWLQKAKERGYTKHIGISNYTVSMMKIAKDHIDGPIVTNQVEFHPLLDQGKLLSAASELNIPLSSYCSMARGAIFKHELFAQLGEDYGKEAGQIALRWILQKGVSINTMSTKPDHIRRNFDVMDFTLSSVDMARIDGLTATNLRINTQDITPFAPRWDSAAHASRPPGGARPHSFP